MKTFLMLFFLIALFPFTLVGGAAAFVWTGLVVGWRIAGENLVPFCDWLQK